MEIRRIALNGFRNYEFASAEFAPGINVISGENAQGKTNLLEAVYLLTGGRSFRTRFDRELIGFDYSGAEVLADVLAHGREQTVKIALRQGQRKQIWVNGVKKTASELQGEFAAVLFCPSDLDIIRSGAAERRRLMDQAIVQLRPGYGALLSEYHRLQEQKTAILKDWQLDSVKVSGRKDTLARYDIRAYMTLAPEVPGDYELFELQCLVGQDTLVFNRQMMQVTEPSIDLETFQPHDIHPQQKFPYTLAELFQKLGTVLLKAVFIYRCPDFFKHIVQEIQVMITCKNRT